MATVATKTVRTNQLETVTIGDTQYTLSFGKRREGQLRVVWIRNNDSGELYRIVHHSNDEVTCSCPGSTYHGHCKHLEPACQFAGISLDGTTSAPTPTPTPEQTRDKEKRDLWRRYLTWAKAQDDQERAQNVSETAKWLVGNELVAWVRSYVLPGLMRSYDVAWDVGDLKRCNELASCYGYLGLVKAAINALQK